MKKSIKFLLLFAVLFLVTTTSTFGANGRQYASIGRTTWDRTPTFIGNTRGSARTRAYLLEHINGVVVRHPNLSGIRSRATLTASGVSSGWVASGSATNNNNFVANLSNVYASVRHTSRARNIRMRGEFGYSLNSSSTWRTNITPLYRTLNP